MEDPRLSRMYAKALAREATSLHSRGERWLRRRREALRWIAIALALFSIGFGYYAHIKGRFGTLKTELKSTPQPESHVLVVGGQEPLVLERAPLNDASTPELLSATFLPGRGMGLLQITAMIPGRGVTPLLVAPTVEALAHDDQQGIASQQLPPSIELPWAGAIPGAAAAANNLTTEWQGQTLQLPVTGHLGNGTPISAGGLLRLVGSDTQERDVMPDGGSSDAHLSLKNTTGLWPSQTEVDVTALLSGRALDLKIVARNAGSEAEPLGAGWIPSIQLPSGSRAQAMLRIPSTEVEEMRDGRATGRLTDVSGGMLDFSAPGGKALQGTALNSTFAHLKTGFLDNGPVLELRDVAAGVGLRMTAFSSQIQAVHVQTDPGSSTIRLGFQTNLDDPLSPAFRTTGPAGITVLEPGQTLTWHVRFEMMALTPVDTAPL